MEQLKKILEALDVRPAVERMRTGDKVAVSIAIVLAVAVGLYLGYDAHTVLDWLGL